MDEGAGGCGALYATYAAAREDDVEGMRAGWTDFDPERADVDGDTLDQLQDAVAAGDTVTVQRAASQLLFRDAEPPTLDGAAVTTLGTVLYWFGYVASFVLFFRAHSREAIVERLRWAYRTVGVDIQDTESLDGTERTTFRCPYRNLGANRYGRRHACHDVLDRVDDGYVTFLERHRGIDYRRPRACAASECCYSEVSYQ